MARLNRNSTLQQADSGQFSSVCSGPSWFGLIEASFARSVPSVVWHCQPASTM